MSDTEPLLDRSSEPYLSKERIYLFLIRSRQVSLILFCLLRLELKFHLIIAFNPTFTLPAITSNMIADRAVTNIKLNSNVAGQGLRNNFIFFIL